MLAEASNCILGKCGQIVDMPTFVAQAGGRRRGQIGSNASILLRAGMRRTQCGAVKCSKTLPVFHRSRPDEISHLQAPETLGTGNAVIAIDLDHLVAARGHLERHQLFNVTTNPPEAERRLRRLLYDRFASEYSPSTPKPLTAKDKRPNEPPRLKQAPPKVGG